MINKVYKPWLARKLGLLVATGIALGSLLYPMGVSACGGNGVLESGAFVCSSCPTGKDLISGCTLSDCASSIGTYVCPPSALVGEGLANVICVTGTASMNCTGAC
ncbi:MAG: hypothetical protein ACHP65_04415 [Legionellales bacterium]